MRIYKFNQFITEKLGVLDNIDSIADLVMDNLKDKNYFRLQIKINDKIIEADCFLKKDLKGSLGSFRHDNKGEFTLLFKSLNKNTIIHELKHLFYKVLGKGKKDKYSYKEHTLINSIGEFTLDRFNFLLKKDPQEILKYTLYYANPDEFEAYYNQFYYELAEEIPKDATKEEKRKIITKKLESNSIFTIYQFYFKHKFNAKIFFKSHRDVNLFTKTLSTKIKEFRTNIYQNKPTSIKNKEVYKQRILKILSIFKKDEPIDDCVKKLNLKVNKSINKNYHKFFRLYTLFDC